MMAARLDLLGKSSLRLPGRRIGGDRVSFRLSFYPLLALRTPYVSHGSSSR